MLPYVIILDESTGAERYVVYAADEAGDPIDEPLGTYDNPGEAALLIYTLMQEGQPEDEAEPEPEAETPAEEEAAADESDDDGKSSENGPNRAAGESQAGAEVKPSSSAKQAISGRKSFIDRARELLAGLMSKQKALTATEQTQVYGFKALGNGWWIGVFSNNFKDRDNEILTAGAHERYILRANFGFVDMPELWFHHIPGSRHGKAVFIDEAEHLIYAIGKFDDTPLGKAFEQFYRTTDWKPGMSHGFRVPAWAKTKDGHILEYNTFEISVLDVKNAANPYTSFVTMEDMKMALTDSQRAALLDARIPKEIRTIVEQNHAQLASQGKSLEALLGNESFKDYADLTDTEAKGKDGKSDTEAKGKGSAEKDEKFFEAQGQMMADLLTTVNKQGRALLIFGKVLEGMAEELGIEIIPASEATETEIPEDDEDDDDLDFDLDEDDEDEAEPKSRRSKARRSLDAKRRGKDSEDTFLGLRLT